MTYTERARALRPYIVKASASLTDAETAAKILLGEEE